MCLSRSQSQFPKIFFLLVTKTWGGGDDCTHHPPTPPPPLSTPLPLQTKHNQIKPFFYHDSKASDESGATVQGEHVIYRFNYDTDQYEAFQSLTGIGASYGLSAFQLTGKQYIFVCNYKDWDGTQDASSYIWVYDNNTGEYFAPQSSIHVKYVSRKSQDDFCEKERGVNPGGGGYSPQIVVGMCRSKVKNGGLRSELERKNAGLRSELGELERENAGIWSELGELEYENAGLRNGLYYRTRQAGILADR